MSRKSYWYTHLTVSYPVIKRRNGYKLFEHFNEPFSPQNNCVAVFDNLAKVVIEIQHSGNLNVVVDRTMFLDNGFKFLDVQVIYVLGNQSFNNLLKVKPPKQKIKEIKT